MTERRTDEQLAKHSTESPAHLDPETVQKLLVRRAEVYERAAKRLRLLAERPHMPAAQDVVWELVTP